MSDSPDPLVSAGNTGAAVSAELLPLELVILDHYARHSRCLLRSLPATLGRGEKDAVRLSDPWISHSHCELFQNGGALLVRDLDSKNGVFLHGVRIREAEVLPGDCVTLGRTEVTVRFGPAADKPLESDTDASPPAPGTRRQTSGPVTEELLY
jgi:pSer/pThr/pTyr-binding forkhead associated (FHA) protein